MLGTSLIAPSPVADVAVRRWRARLDPWAALGVAAHITVAAPFLSISRVTSDTLHRLGVVAAGQRQFTVSLDRIVQLPGAVSLLPADDSALARLTDSVVDEFPEISDRLRTGRDRPYHLTVACLDDAEVFGEIERSLRPMLPIEAQVASVQLLGHDSAQTRVLADLRLAS
jgi:2'-5' RNA ligase superfamily